MGLVPVFEDCNYFSVIDSGLDKTYIIFYVIFQLKLSTNPLFTFVQTFNIKNI